MSSKQILLILRHPPFANGNNKDALDLALACSAFDISVSILLMGDAVLQITALNDTQKIQQKNLANTFKALPMYDINECYAIEEDIDRFNINTQGLALPCQMIAINGLPNFIEKFDTVINL